MKTLLSLFLLLALGASAATGIKISEYPNTPVLTNSELFIVAVTNVTPATNRNITYGQLRSLLSSNNFVGSFTGNGVNLSNVVASSVSSGVTNQWRQDATNAVSSFSTSNNWIGSFTGDLSGGTNFAAGLDPGGFPNISIGPSSNPFIGDQADIYGINSDAATLPMLMLEHNSTNAYSLEIHNYPRAKTALMIHNYSSNAPAIRLDSTSTQPFIIMRNTTNGVLSPGTRGLSAWLQLEGYPLPGGLGSVDGTTLLCNFDEALVFHSLTTTKPISFTNDAGGVGLIAYGNSAILGYGLVKGIRGETTGLVPVSYVGIVGESGQAMGNGTTIDIGVVGVARGTGDAAGDKNWGGWFAASAYNNVSAEGAIYAQVADADNTSTLFKGVASGVQKVLIDGNGNISASGSMIATNTHLAANLNVTTPGFKSLGTNGVVLTCPDGGSFILRVDNAGTLTTVTNSGGL